MVREVRLIFCDEKVIGNGTEADPERKVFQFWTPEGELLLELDPEKKRTRINLSCVNGEVSRESCIHPQ